MELGWDPAKRAANVAKHGVDFVYVFAAFDDPARVVRVDDRFEYGEARFNMLAHVSGRLYHVTYTERGDVFWLISARKANAREQRRHGEG